MNYLQHKHKQLVDGINDLKEDLKIDMQIMAEEEMTIILYCLVDKFHRIFFKMNPQLQNKRRAFFERLNLTLSEYDNGLDEDFDQCKPAHIEGLIRFDKLGHFKLITDFYESNGLSKSDYFIVTENKPTDPSVLINLKYEDASLSIKKITDEKEKFEQYLCPHEDRELIRLTNLFLGSVATLEAGEMH